MMRCQQRRVVRFTERPNDSQDETSRRLWPVCTSAELECGHVNNLGVGTSYRPKRMSCPECGAPTVKNSAMAGLQP